MELELTRAEADEQSKVKHEMTELAGEALHRRDGYVAETATLAAQKGQLNAEISALEDRLHDYRTKDIPDVERAGRLRIPIIGQDQLVPTSKGEVDEQAFLETLEAAIGKAGFNFDPRLLRAFHTSLKIADAAPLTVLAGISGTGKSELPRLYADLGGLPILEIAIQPSWDSPHDLFGFYNYTDGRFKAEPLARLLYQMNDTDNPLGQGPCIVLLDEMNLARVEYYFSEMLSKLEARRADKRARNDANRASVSIDLGPGKSESLYLDERILFVGTMNNDESTMTLSDKVLDRASTITFPAPRDMKLTQAGEITKATQRVSWSTWQSWCRPPTEDENCAKLNKINDIMDDLGRPFGHRLFRAIHAYLANYPGDGQIHKENAWADQMEMKIFPRLRGLECEARGIKGHLEALKGQIPESRREAFDAARDGEFFAFNGARSSHMAKP